MNKAIFISILCVIFSASLNAQQNENYYYHQGKKIFLQQSSNKVFLKFAQNADREQVRELINNTTFLQLASSSMTIEDKDYIDFVILETREEDDILSSAAIKSFKTSPIVISATSLFLYNEFPQGLTDEFAVKLKPTISYNRLQELAEKNNCFIKEENSFVKNQFIISVSKNAYLNAMEMSRLFYETSFFEFAEPNFIVFNAFHSNDAHFNEQWALKNTGQSGGVSDIDMKVEQAWATALGTNIKVAIVDMGVDLTHPDLQANILLPGYENPSSGNNNGAAVTSYDNHGTPCAGIIGAIKDNGIGTAGVAPNCQIKPARISTLSGGLNLDWAAAAIDWAWQSGADVISNSWGGGSAYQPIIDAVNRATSQGRGGKGCVVVFSSGNNNASTVNFPASLPNVIAVGAIDRCGIRSGRIDVVPNSCDPWCIDCHPGSTFGTALSVVAPGTNVYTTDRQGSAGYNTASGTAGNYDCCFGGTSAACPNVAGVAALVLSANSNLTWQQTRNIIERTAQRIGDYDYQAVPSRPNWNNQVGYGLVDAYAAVQEAKVQCTINFTNQIVTTNTTVTSCGDINVQNVKVQNGAKLTLDAVGDVNIISDFEVELDSEFEIVYH